MPQVYHATVDTANLTNVSATRNYQVKVNPNVSTIATTLPTIAAGGTQTISFYTPPGLPGLFGNVTSNLFFQYQITTANNNVSARVTFRRINSAGVVQTSSAATASISFGTTGVKQFTLTGVSLGTFLATDRVRIDVLATNGNNMTAQSYAFGVPGATTGITNSSAFIAVSYKTRFASTN
jgi:hypothetical protein